uniref:Runt domain-containing protein n=1 Tax=Echinostoma caproni TaxID=27848 RepID=A0A183A9A9_9TREM
LHLHHFAHITKHTMDLIQTSSPHLFCTPLPKHWRSNKSLPNQFRVVSLITIPDGTRVSVSAGNEDRPFAELKNPITVMHGNEARFSDLRFLGRSGRGESFFSIIVSKHHSVYLHANFSQRSTDHLSHLYTSENLKVFEIRSVSKKRSVKVS